MSENSHEQISALMDGELTEDHLYTLNALKNSPEYRKAWSHYHLIGESLRNNLPSHIDMRLADRICTAIKDEPDTMTGKPRRFSLSDYFKPALGFAIAASVTVAVIFGIRQSGDIPGLDSTQTLAQQTPAATPQQQTGVNTAIAGVNNPPVVRNFQTPTDARSRLNRYLVNHNEYRTNIGVQGMLPYVRIVAHEVGE